jgi:hypothetical protein
MGEPRKEVGENPLRQLCSSNGGEGDCISKEGGSHRVFGLGTRGLQHDARSRARTVLEVQNDDCIVYSTF